jgi:hypothetical protein
MGARARVRARARARVRVRVRARVRARVTCSASICRPAMARSCARPSGLKMTWVGVGGRG